MTDDELVRALCEIESGLTDWEVGFVESISSQVIDRGRSLTERQREFAEKIFDEKA